MRLGTAFAALAILVPGAAFAQAGAVVETHGEWQLRCFAEGEGRGDERCALDQYVVAEDRNGASLRLLVWRDNETGPILQVLTPLDVRLRSRISMTVDDELVGRMEFERCSPDGCVAEVLLDEATVTRLRDGATVVFGYQLNADAEDQPGIGFPIALEGFAEAFDALANEPPAGG